jgi:hypothetical protein
MPYVLPKGVKKPIDKATPLQVLSRTILNRQQRRDQVACLPEHCHPTYFIRFHLEILETRSADLAGRNIDYFPFVVSDTGTAQTYH